MQQRILGNQGLAVSALGLGCMSMTGTYGTGDEAGGIATIQRALDLGVTFFDTAEVYGGRTNETLLGKALAGRRETAIVATKFGFTISPEGAMNGFDGTPANAKRVADESLRRLKLDVIDLYYQHRRDPAVPIEETVGAMKELVDAGKVRFLGLSEVGEETLRRACSVHPIAALQSEYSLWERDLERLFPVLRELGIGLVPFSPLGRGFLTGAVAVEDLGEKDWRKTNPRFSEENARKNRALVEIVRRVATRKQATPAQIALAWVLAQGTDIVPIPGTKRVKYLEDNLGALDVTLDAHDLSELDAIKDAVAGERYTPEMMAAVDR